MFNWNDLRCKGRQTYAGDGKTGVKCGLSLRNLRVNSATKNPDNLRRPGIRS